MTEALAGPAPVDAAAGRLDVSRSQAVRRFKWMILAPLLPRLLTLHRLLNRHRILISSLEPQAMLMLFASLNKQHGDLLRTISLTLRRSESRLT